MAGYVSMGDWLHRVAGFDPPKVELAGGTLSSLESTTVVEYNVTLTSANTEYSQALPTNARRLCFRCRSSVAIRYAWVTGKVATPTAPYQSLQSGAEYAIDGVMLAGSTVYFASSVAGAVVEMEAWS